MNNMYLSTHTSTARGLSCCCDRVLRVLCGGGVDALAFILQLEQAYSSDGVQPWEDPVRGRPGMRQRHPLQRPPKIQPPSSQPQQRAPWRHMQKARMQGLQEGREPWVLVVASTASQHRHVRPWAKINLVRDLIISKLLTGAHYGCWLVGFYFAKIGFLNEVCGCIRNSRCVLNTSWQHTLARDGGRCKRTGSGDLAGLFEG